jgi:hypothetical protein
LLGESDFGVLFPRFPWANVNLVLARVPAAYAPKRTVIAAAKRRAHPLQRVALRGKGEAMALYAEAFLHIGLAIVLLLHASGTIT